MEKPGAQGTDHLPFGSSATHIVYFSPRCVLGNIAEELVLLIWRVLRKHIYMIKLGIG